MSGKTINLFIRNDGIKIAELTENRLRAYFGEFSQLKILEKENKISGACIYLLLDKQDEIKKIYAGKTTNASNRFIDHKRKKDWANSFIIFNGPPLEQLHLDYVEKHLSDKIIENALDLEVDNSQKQNQAHYLNESNENDAKRILESIIFMLKHLNILNLANLKDKNLSKNKDIFYIHLKGKNKDKTAKLIKEGGQYILLEGSYLEVEQTNSFRYTESIKRDYYEAHKFLIKKDALFYSAKNIPFKSASGASNMVKASSTNGNIEWKLANGTSLGDFQNR